MRVRTALLSYLPALLAAVAFAAPAGAAPVTFGEGHLDWGFKQSFREYVALGAAAGEYTASDGATKLSEPTGVIRFDVLGGPYDDETGVGELLIDGTVHFTGHEGDLDMTIENLRLDLAGATGTLHADLASKDRESGTMRECRDVALGNLGSIPAPAANGSDGLTWSSIPVTLAEAAAPVFETYYAPTPESPVDLDPLAPLVADYGTPRPRPDGGNPGTPTEICGDEPPGPTDPPPGNGGGGGGGGGGTTVPDPAPKLPQVSSSAKAVTLGSGRVVATIATLRCGGAPCAVKFPKSVKVKIGRKRYAVAVLAPKSLATGKTGKLQVKLSKKARKALTGRKATVNVKVAVVAGGRQVAKTVKATLKAKRAKG